MSTKLKLQINKSEAAQIMDDGQEARQVSITFVFNPTEIECIRTKDGHYIVRDRK